MIVVVIIGLLASMAIPAFQKVRIASQDKAVLNNVRLLAAASDQYFLQYGTSSADFSYLVGASGYVKSFNKVAGEVYPTIYVAGETIVVTSIAGARTISYSN